MRIGTCLVTYNRRVYTLRTIHSLLATTDPEWTLAVSDNGSDDGTIQDLRELNLDLLILNPSNLFPGAACNKGWHQLLKTFNADLLHRSDNDIEYQPGWSRYVREAFQAMPKLGQLGLLNLSEDYPDGQPLDEYTENGVTVNRRWPRVGGVSVIRRELWDMGLRWKPGPWAPGGQDEDGWMSQEVTAAGYFVANAIPTIARNIAYHRYDDYPDYYNQTAAVRGLVPELSV